MLDALGFPQRRRRALLHQRPRHDDRRASTWSPPIASGLATSGRWNLTAAYNYNKTEDRQAPQRARAARARSRAWSCSAGSKGIRFTDGQPHDKVVLSADGDIGKFGVTARTTRYGKVISPGAAAPLAEPDQPDRAWPGRHPARRQVDHRPRGPAARRPTASNSRSAPTTCSTSIPTVRPSARGRRRSAASIRPTRIYIPYSIFSPFGFNGRFLYGRVVGQLLTKGRGEGLRPSPRSIAQVGPEPVAAVLAARTSSRSPGWSTGSSLSSATRFCWLT